MTEHVSFSDAVVALRSFPRRFREVLSGPPGDDAWERLVRRPGAGGQSALDHGAQAAALMSVLGGVLAGLPTTATPSAAVPARRPVGPDTAIDDVLERIAGTSGAAAEALAARRSDDAKRNVQWNTATVSIGQMVSAVVGDVADHLRHASAALEDAR